MAIYMDYNASAPLRPEAIAAVSEALKLTGNPSSVHGFGRAARGLLERARASVATLAAARPEQVIFTAGGTEANNLAIKGSGRGRVLVSAGEHDSVLRAAVGAEVIPLRRDGRLDLAALDRLLAADEAPALVCVMHANNETGVVQPVAEAAALAHEAGALLHCDAVQAAGKLPLDMAALGADMITLSAHKLGGPMGVGALVLGPEIAVSAILAGGGQERGRRAGTENLSGAAGFAAAAEAAVRDLERMATLQDLRDTLEKKVAALAPEARIFGAESPRLANTTCFAAPGLAAEIQVMALDLAGVAVSAGSACSSGKLQPSHVLRAMGASEEEAGSAIRVSLGWRSEAADVESFVEAWRALYRRSRRPASSAA